MHSTRSYPIMSRWCAPDGSVYELKFRERKVPNIPAELLHEIYKHLGPCDLARVAKASRMLRDTVQTHHRLALNALLRVFFPHPGEIDAFRRLQAEHGVLISGSSAIQFFENAFIPGSDLDVYVEYKHGPAVLDMLLGMGFVFLPRKTQGAMYLRQNMMQRVERLNDRGEQYNFSGIDDVYDFERDGKKVQLITAKGTPIEIILSFHCTAPMNFLTHDRAYSLYPNATFVKRLALNIETCGSGQDAGRKKYAARGWALKDPDGVSAHDATNPKSELSTHLRWVGDAKCLVVNLPPLANLRLKSCKVATHALGANSWKVMYASDGKAELEVGGAVFAADKFSYCVHWDVKGLVELLEKDGIKLVQQRTGCSSDALLGALAPKFYAQMERVQPAYLLKHFEQPEILNELVVDLFKTVATV